MHIALIAGILAGMTLGEFSASVPAIPVNLQVSAHAASERAEVAHPDLPRVERPRSRLSTPDGAIATGVGEYTDCTHHAEVPHDRSVIDQCFGGRAYFLGHNPGIFTPLMRLQVGDQLTWNDSSGNEHQLRIVAIRVVSRFGGQPLPVSPEVVAQFQTCEVPDGSWDRILDAVAA